MQVPLRPFSVYLGVPQKRQGADLAPDLGETQTRGKHDLVLFDITATSSDILARVDLSENLDCALLTRAVCLQQARVFDHDNGVCASRQGLTGVDAKDLTCLQAILERDAGPHRISPGWCLRCTDGIPVDIRRWPRGEITLCHDILCQDISDKLVIYRHDDWLFLSAVRSVLVDERKGFRHGDDGVRTGPVSRRGPLPRIMGLVPRIARLGRPWLWRLMSVDPATVTVVLMVMMMMVMMVFFVLVVVVVGLMMVVRVGAACVCFGALDGRGSLSYPQRALHGRMLCLSATTPEELEGMAEDALPIATAQEHFAAFLHSFGAPGERHEKRSARHAIRS